MYIERVKSIYNTFEIASECFKSRSDIKALDQCPSYLCISHVDACLQLQSVEEHFSRY